MSINFVVETGTGLVDATSYVDIDDFKQYWEDLGVSITDTNDTIMAWLNEATRYADLSYSYFSTATTLISTSPYRKTQALEFPRVFWGTEIPIELKRGICELAYARKGVDPNSKVTSGISSESYGAVSVSYTSGNNSNSKAIYKTANLFMRCISFSKKNRVSPT